MRSFILASLSLAAASAIAMPVFDRPSTSPVTFQNSWLPPDGLDSDGYAYDNFYVSTDCAITRVDWRGQAPNLLQGFKIVFYESTAGIHEPHIDIPEHDTIFLKKYQINSQANPVTCTEPGYGGLYDYHVDLATPFNAIAAKEYWIRITADQTSYLPWGITRGGNGSHFGYFTGQHMFLWYPGDMAFKLSDNRGWVTGTVHLQDTTKVLNHTADFNLLDAAGTVVETISNVPLGTDGSFTLGTQHLGVYSLAAKSSTFLQQNVGEIDISSAISSSVGFSLVNGDVDGDNEIALGDFGLLSGAFGTFAGEPAYLSNADLDEDGEVGLSDFGILSSNFGLIGD